MSDSALSDRAAATGAEPRLAALAAAARLTVMPTGVVEFNSAGRVLVIGHYAAVVAALDALPEPLTGWALVTRDSGPGRDNLFYSSGRPVRLEGHLGNYRVTLGDGDKVADLGQLWGLPEGIFDLVLDLQQAPLLTYPQLPFGYAAPGPDPGRVTDALTDFARLVGDFEKPKYFELNPAICAHSRSRLKGCSRCLETCPTGAITALVEAVSIDPFYCQGGGSCASACPTGAISYRYPSPADTIDRMRAMLRAYREAGGTSPVLVIHDGETGQRHLEQCKDSLPAAVIPLLVEDLGSVGLESWLAALAFGACRVLLLDTPEVPDSVRRELQDQLAVAQVLLVGMGYQATGVGLVRVDTARSLDVLIVQRGMPALTPAGFAGSNEKRTMLYAAIDWLQAQAPQSPASVDLPDAAPFGEVRVDGTACTLCFACVSVCPAAALTTGADRPQLRFVEANCVQCGLCEQACPEDAIGLQQRIVLDREVRRRSRTLQEEAPFCCVVCGTPFATRSVIAAMTTRLQGHWMFADERALRRLQMCGDCRVRDMFADADRSNSSGT